MPNRGTKEARTALVENRGWMNDVFGRALPYTDQAGSTLNWLSGGGPGNIQEILAALGALTQYIQGQGPQVGRNIAFPKELGDIFNNITTGIARSEELINNQGRTANSATLWERLMDAFTKGTLTNGIKDPAQGIINRGGYTPTMGELNDVARQLISFGGFTAPLMDAEKTASSIIASQGRTPETGDAVNQFLNIVRSGGRDSGTQALFGQGQTLMGNGGVTPQMAQTLAQIQSLMSAGGMTPEARQLFGKAMDVVNAGGAGGALLPMDQVVGFAREDAAALARQKAEAARRMAIQRQGFAISSPSTETILNDNLDQTLESIAAATRGAMTEQQKLQLSQYLGALGAGTDITKGAQGLLGQLSGASGDIFRSASSNLATGAGLMTDAEKLAATRLGIGQGGLNATLATELGRFSTAEDLLRNVNLLAQGRLGMGSDIMGKNETLASGNIQAALQALQGAAGIELGAGEALGRVNATDTATLIQALASLGQFTGQGASMGQFQQSFDLNSFNSTVGSWLQALTASGGLANNEFNGLLNVANSQAGLGQMFLALMPSLFSNQGGLSQALIQAANQPGFWSQLAQSAMKGVAGGLSGGVAGLISGLGKAPTPRTTP